MQELAPGTPGRIVFGPFEGLSARVVRFGAGLRVALTYEGQQISVEIPRSEFEPDRAPFAVVGSRAQLERDLQYYLHELPTMLWWIRAHRARSAPGAEDELAELYASFIAYEGRLEVRITALGLELQARLAADPSLGPSDWRPRIDEAQPPIDLVEALRLPKGHEVPASSPLIRKLFEASVPFRDTAKIAWLRAQSEAPGEAPLRNQGLEAALVATPDQPEPYRVYADWLQEHEDPRGALIALQVPEASKFMQTRAQRLIESNAVRLLGPLCAMAGSPWLKWRWGFVQELALDLERAADSVKALETFLAHPSALALRTLRLETAHAKVLERGLGSILADARALGHLFVGGSKAPPYLEPLEGRLKSPILRSWESLHLRVSEVELQRLEPENLRALRLEVSRLTLKNLRALLSVEWPKLQTLELWFGPVEGEAKAWLEALQPLFSGRLTPTLRRLGLVNTSFTDPICQSLSKAKLANQLQLLDLSLGRMSARGAKHLTSGLRNLKLLDLRGLRLSKAMRAALKGLDAVILESPITPRPRNVWDGMLFENSNRFP